MLTPEKIRADFTRNLGITAVESYALSFVVAEDKGGGAAVWVRRVLFGRKEDGSRWIVTNGGDFYMFKEDGLFGYTGKSKDRIENSFETAEEAMKAFYHFYKNPGIK